MPINREDPWLVRRSSFSDDIYQDEKFRWKQAERLCGRKDLIVTGERAQILRFCKTECAAVRAGQRSPFFAEEQEALRKDRIEAIKNLFNDLYLWCSADIKRICKKTFLFLCGSSIRIFCGFIFSISVIALAIIFKL